MGEWREGRRRATVDESRGEGEGQAKGDGAPRTRVGCTQALAKLSCVCRPKSFIHEITPNSRVPGSFIVLKYLSLFIS